MFMNEMHMQCFQGSWNLDLFKQKRNKHLLVKQFISFFFFSLFFSFFFFSLPLSGLQDKIKKIKDSSSLPWTLSLCTQECVDLLFFLELSGGLQHFPLIVLTVCFKGVPFSF